MLKIHEIREIIKLIDQSGITHFELENEGDKLLIRKEAAVVSAPQIQKVEVQPQMVAEPVVEVKRSAVDPVPAVSNAEIPVESVHNKMEEDATLHKITSPMVGTFYEAPSPGAKPYVSVGDHVEKNTVVCIVEAMKLFNEIEAEVRGTIVKVLVENGQLVEYGQPLFLVKPE
jgi:acetyl-CoA carboxylase biotin carboxyl carrier protein